MPKNYSCKQIRRVCIFIFFNKQIKTPGKLFERVLKILGNSVSKFTKYSGDKYIQYLQLNNLTITKIPQKPFSKMPSGFLLKNSLFLIIKCHVHLEEISYLICPYFSFNLSVMSHTTNNHLSVHKRSINWRFVFTSATFVRVMTQDNGEPLCSWLFLAH